jgi:hypothetical protein
MELNYLVSQLGSSKNVQFERQLSFTARSETFVVSNIAKMIYNDNFSLDYYRRYMESDVANDMYDPTSMHQVFKCMLSNYLKKIETNGRHQIRM